MHRIATAFEHAKAQGRAAFIPYMCAGDYSVEASLAIAKGLVAAGADILEVALPFSDPLADGPTNQASAARALAAGFSVDDFFAWIRALRAECPEVPLVAYTYYNLIYRRGEGAFCKAAAEAGLDGMLVLDLPPEEAESFIKHSRAHGLANIFTLTPTTPPARVASIATAGSGFVYYVCRLGVTGARESLPEGFASSLEALKAQVSAARAQAQLAPLPLVVGFGISTPQQVAEVGQLAEGVVVGSALVKRVAEAAEAAMPGEAAAGHVCELAAELAGALRA